MTKSKATQIISIGGSSTVGYGVLVIGGLGLLYILSQRPGGKDTTYKESILEKIGSAAGGAVSDIGSGVIQGTGNILGEAVIGTPKKVVEESEQKTSSTTFQDQPRTDVAGWFATGGTKKSFNQPVTYKQFIEEQPITVRVPVAMGNVITADYASKYGSYVATETKKGQAVAGQDPAVEARRFTTLDPISQSFIGLGQAITVPFGGGGAVGWGAATKKRWFS